MARARWAADMEADLEVVAPPRWDLSLHRIRMRSGVSAVAGLAP